MYNDAHIYTGFRVSNRLLSRRRACRIVESVPGVRILRSPKRWAWHSEDDFCAFELAGTEFLIVEPFGDNTEYWIVAAEPDPAARPLIDHVRPAFASAWG